VMGWSRAILALLALAGASHGLSTAKTQSLFDEPYRPEDSRHFVVGSSTTFTPDATKTFDLSYADGTELKGFNGQDVVQLGNYHGMAPFGVIYSCNSPDFNGVDGILGFGLPKPGGEGRELPRPILWALTDKGAVDSNAQDLLRKFSFFSTDSTAELQLGGYDPATCTDEMQYTPSLSKTDFIVGVTSMTYGKPGAGEKRTELLQFESPSGGEYLPAIMDSGTSCLVIPGDTLGGRLKNSPFDDFTNLWDEGTSFWVTVGGKTFEIPYSSWFLQETKQTCVQPAPAGMQGLLIGDVFFREYMVEFDMMDEGRPIIGIAKLNKEYTPVTTAELGMYKLHQAPRQKLQLLKGEETMYSAEHSERLDQVDQVPIFNKKGTQYFMDVGIGSPSQPFTVIFDTGSAVFGVFTMKDTLPSTITSKLHDSVSFKVHVDAMNTLMQWHGSETLQGQAVVMAAAGADMSRAGGDGSPFQWVGRMARGVSGWGVGLFVAGLVVGNVVLGRRVFSREARGKRAEARRTRGDVDMSYSYGTVQTVPVEVL